MPKMVSSKTLENMMFAATTFINAAEVISGKTEDADCLEDAIELIRSHWPGVTARDLTIAGIAVAFCHEVLDGAAPKLGRASFCSSLLVTECNNLKAHGLGGGAE